jgi:energy-coupling factor transporter ATP-binding protein EcfA2
VSTDTTAPEPEPAGATTTEPNAADTTSAEAEPLGMDTLFSLDEFGSEATEDPSAEGVFAGLAASRSEEATGAPLRLRRIRLSDILGFKDATIYPSNFSVLVGANNSGKSSLMRAVSFAQTLLRVHVERMTDAEVILARGRNLDDSLLPVPEVKDLWFGGIRRRGNDWVMAEVELEFESGRTIGFGLKGPFGHATSRLLGDSRRIPREDFDRLTSFPIVYVPSSVGVVDREEYRTPARIGSLIAGGRAHEVLRNLLLDLHQNGRLNEVADVLARYFEGIIDSVSFDLGSDEYIHVSYKEDSDHDLFSAGAGFLQVLQLITFLVHERPGILLVDEPDAHLHSSLQRLVVDVLRQASQELGLQVLLATHSKEIVNYVDPGELLVIDRKQTELRGLGEHESAISILESLGSVDSIDAYQVITRRKVLLVEGGSDQRTLRALAAKRDSHVFEGTDRLVVIETGGESTPTAKSDLKILETMMGNEVQSLQLLDRDARLQQFIDEAEERSPRPLHIWRRDAIESYLVVPSAIARLVHHRKPELDPDDVADFVERTCAEVVEELRDETFDRVATRYRRDLIARESRNVEPSEANQAAREAMEDPEQLRRLTHGKQLLAAVRKRVQDEYGVSFGNQALIAEVLPEELDPELWEVLDTIEALARS